jgi:hypothetical protein
MHFMALKNAFARITYDYEFKVYESVSTAE